MFEDRVVEDKMLPPLPLPPPPLPLPPLPPTLTMVGTGVAFTVNGWEELVYQRCLGRCSLVAWQQELPRQRQFVVVVVVVLVESLSA